MTNENKTNTTENSSSDNAAWGALIGLLIIVSILGGLYGRYRSYIDFLTVLVGSFSVISIMFFIYQLVEKYDITFDKQELLLFSSITLLWVPIIVTPICDMIMPSQDNTIERGIRMAGLLLIFLIMVTNVFISIIFISLYKKSYQQKIPNRIEQCILKNRWSIIPIMYFVSAVGFIFGTGYFWSIVSRLLHLS
jgi:hypothetical protein